jgi:hypothetical protein
MSVTTALILVSFMAVAVVLVEVARRAVSGRAVDEELRRAGARPAPTMAGLHRVAGQIPGRRAA